MLSYLLGEGIRGLFKNRMMTFASIATIALSLLTLGISYSIATNFEYLIAQIEEKIGISVYLDDVFTEKNIVDLQETIKNIKYVKEVSYISKDVALKTFAGDDILLYEEFKEDNPLPASFEIKPTDVQFQRAVVSQLEKMGLDATYFSTETQIFLSLNAYIQRFSLLFIVILIIISLLLITNTIRLTVFVRKKEIEIMKFLGATDNFIRTPFIIEGILIGIIGAVIPSIFIYCIYDIAAEKLLLALSELVGGLILQDIDLIITWLLPVYFSLAISISVVGSCIAISKYLRV
ncbi:hypothetical protein AN643_03210 [Candidatus Epulonipiscioides saccharophilum]|nr:hypothetical protein AN643_03210 [Epulopiscium sp. SCG-B10WGA-EpuloB]